MTRLIDADDLLFALGLDDMTEADGYKMDLMRSDIRDAINDAPTVDAVEIVKEEKKMLNVEKYLTAIKEEIAKDACASKACLIAKVRGGERPDCNDRTCRDCSDESLGWLFSEYEPQLLKNGDGLKPGGEILVKNSNYANWEREKFLCYLDGLFFTTYNLDLPYSPEEFRAACWRYARLPEDGE